MCNQKKAYSDCLLDEMAALVGCVCLSDMRTEEFREKLVEVLTSLPTGKYPVAQWNEAAGYLSGEKNSFDSEAEARCFLKKKLNRVR